MDASQVKEQLQVLMELNSKYRNDERHASFVESAALKVFDCLKTSQSFTDSERDLLSHASLLHDIGNFISSRKHNKHSKYIIDNDNLLSGYPDDEKRLLSLIVYNHRKKLHKDMSMLSRKEKDTVIKLSAILRIADSIDYTREAFEISNVSIIDSELKITLTGILPERISGRLQQKKGLFVEIFGLDISLDS